VSTHGRSAPAPPAPAPTSSPTRTAHTISTSPSDASRPSRRGSGDLRLQHFSLGRLDDEQARHKLEELGRVVHRAATPELEPGTGWASERWRQRLDDLRHVDGYQATKGDRVVGFVLYRTFPLCDRRALQLFSAYVLPDHQGLGLAFAMNARIVFRELTRHPLAHHYLVAPMMVPIALRGWRDRIADGRWFYPAMPGSEPPSDSLVHAATTAAAQRYATSTFDARHGVLHGLTPARDRPPADSGDATVDQHFHDHVDPRRGDAVLMVIDASAAMVLASLGRLAAAAPRAWSARRREPRP
jgi:hypothetical protein